MVDVGGALTQLAAAAGAPPDAANGSGAAGGAAGADAAAGGASSSANVEQAILRAREKLTALRLALVSRALQRATDGKQGEGVWLPPELRAHPDQYPPRPDPPKPQWEMQLLRILITLLLDRSTTLPVDVDALHRRLSQGPMAEDYQRCLAALDLPHGPHPVLAQLSAEQMLEALQLHLGPRAGGGPTRMWISQINRHRLASLVGIADPGAMIMLAEQQAQQLQTAALSMQMMQQAAMGLMRPPGMPQLMGAPLGMPSVIGGPGDLMLPSILPGMGGGGDLGPRPPSAQGGDGGGGGTKRAAEGDLDSLLNRKTMRDRMMERGAAAELQAVLTRPTAKEAAQLEAFRTADGASAIQEHCPNLTKEDCKRANNSHVACPRLHFRRIIRPHTDVSLGNCSYLNTCRNFNRCKYIHYDIDDDDELMAGPRMGPGGALALAGGGGPGKGPPPVPKYLQALQDEQWIRCDIRKLDMKVLGKFGVIMADPPWQIHQDLPYGTMEDEEMRRMDIGCLQDDGVIFLWVTGRAMELGRECLKIWGYNRVDELIWIKTNQLNRLIRTGRTGHWINHSKEHCLIGVKGKPQLNKYVDCDVVVAEVRETSRKPDEMYTLLERLSPGTRKLEIFARSHNLKPGWVGLGNQLDGVKILDPDFRERYIARYGPPGPDGKLPVPPS